MHACKFLEFSLSVLNSVYKNPVFRLHPMAAIASFRCGNITPETIRRNPFYCTIGHVKPSFHSNIKHNLPNGHRRSGLQHPVAPCATMISGAQAPEALTLTLAVGDREITLQTGEIGRQASGAIMARDGETMLYTTACADEDSSGDGSFAPLQIHYSERFSAAGRTVGGYLKREAKPKDHEVLVARLVDRPIRPMIISGWTHSTQVLQWVMSYDGLHSPEPLAITAAGAALAISEVPIKSVVAGVRVGLLPERGFVINPTVADMETSTLDLIVAGTADAVLMIEGFCDFLTEDEMLEVGVQWCCSYRNTYKIDDLVCLCS